MQISRRGLLYLGAGGVGLAASGAGHAQSGTTVKIGAALGLTGPFAGYALAMQSGMKLAVSDLNAKGGILGKQVELVVRDHQNKIDLGITSARDLITREGVDFLIGPDGSSMAIAVSNVAKQYKRIDVSSIAGSPRLTGELFHQYYFTLVPSGIMLGRSIAEGLGKASRNIAWIGADYEAPHQEFDYFSERLANAIPEAKIGVQQWPKLGETDFSPYISSIVSSKPDVLVCLLNGADIIAFVKQAKPYGLFDAMKFATALFLDDIKAIGRDLPDGVIAFTYAPAQAVNTPQMKDFLGRYKAAYSGDVPSDWAIRSYDAVMVLAAGSAAAKTTNSDAVSKALEALTFTSLTGPITFRALDHQASVPMFQGVTATSPDLPYKILTNLKEIPADSLWPSRAEIEAQRKKT